MRKTFIGYCACRTLKMQVAAVTTGLKCAQEIGPNIEMSAINAPTVAPALARSCSATSLARFISMLPESTTELISRAVPGASAKSLFLSQLLKVPDRELDKSSKP